MLHRIPPPPRHTSGASDASSSGAAASSTSELPLRMLTASSTSPCSSCSPGVAASPQPSAGAASAAACTAPTAACITIATCALAQPSRGSCATAELPSSSTRRLPPSPWLEGRMLMEATASSAAPWAPPAAAADAGACRQPSAGAAAGAPREPPACEWLSRGEAGLAAARGTWLAASWREEGRSGVRSSGEAGGTLSGETCRWESTVPDVDAAKTLGRHQQERGPPCANPMRPAPARHSTHPPHRFPPWLQAPAGSRRFQAPPPPPPAPPSQCPPRPAQPAGEKGSGGSA